MPGGILRGAGPAGSAAMLLFAYWAFLILNSFYRANPAYIERAYGHLTPRFPAAAFSWENALAVLSRAVCGHAGVLVWLAAVTGAGLILTRLFWARRPCSAGMQLLPAIGLGMAVGIPLWLALGLLGIYHSEVAWTFAAGGALGLFFGRRMIREIRAGWAGRWFLLAPGAEAALLVFLALVWALSAYKEEIPAAGVLAMGVVILGGWAALAARTLAGSGSGFPVRMLAFEMALAVLIVAAASNAPERFYDAQVYHLGLPSLFAMHHKMIGLPNLMHASFPLGMHVLYEWQWLLGGEVVTRAWRPWLFALILWAVFRLAKREGLTGAGLAAASMFATMPILATNALQTSVDLEVCLMILLGAGAMREARRRKSDRWMLLCAIFLGAACAMKYTAVFWAPWLFVLSLGGGGNRRPVGGRALLFALVVACWTAPWLIRNAAVVGNPVYPYATAIFREGRQWDPPRQVRFLEQQSTYAIESAADLIRLPWLLIKGDTSETFIGPLPALFAPLLAASWPPGPAASVFGALAGLSIASWIGVTHIHRFLLATWGIVCLLISLAVFHVRISRVWLGRGLLLLLAAVGAVNLFALLNMWGRNFDAVGFLAARESAAGYLERKILNSYYSLAVSADEWMPTRGRIMMIGETRGLYWPRPFLTHSVYDIQVFEEVVMQSFSADEAAKRLKQRGVTHLYLNDVETSRMINRFGYTMLTFNEREKALTADLWRRWLGRGPAGGRYRNIYALLSGARPVPVPLPLPISFDPERLRMKFEGYTEITWHGEGAIRAEKKISKKRAR